MKLSLAVVLVVAACGPKGSAPSLHNDTAGGQATLGQALARDVGAGLAVAIVPGPDGLRAISADGARSQTLVGGEVPWALVDNRAEVVWFGSPDASQLRMLDLAAPAQPAPEPVVIATGLPTESGAGGPLCAIRYPDAAEPDLDYSNSILPRIVVELGPTPRLTSDGGILDLWDQGEAFAAEVAKAALPGSAELRRVAARGAGRTIRLYASAASAGRVAEVPPDGCEEPDLCGDAQAIPGTALWRVVVGHSCGDGCYLDWQIYDPARKAFLPEPWAHRLVQAAVAPDGSAFVTDGQVIRFDTGPLGRSSDDDDGPVFGGGGWLGGVQVDH
ncbi:MAG: hypothetical protein R3B06_22770 [Kofleriaceae bacterium]